MPSKRSQTKLAGVISSLMMPQPMASSGLDILYWCDVTPLFRIWRDRDPRSRYPLTRMLVSLGCLSRQANCMSWYSASSRFNPFNPGSSWCSSSSSFASWSSSFAVKKDVEEDRHRLRVLLRRFLRGAVRTAMTYSTTISVRF